MPDTPATPNYADLFAAALQLPTEQRLQLIGDLWDSVPEDEDVKLSPEWREEIERRSAEIDSGAAETVDWETVRADLFRRVGLDRGA